MNIDDRLSHAFSDLEDRVTTSIKNRPAPHLEPPPRRPRFVVAVAAAAVVAAAVALPVLFLQSDGDDTAASTTTTTLVSTTQGPIVSSTTAAPPESRFADAVAVVTNVDGIVAVTDTGTVRTVTAEFADRVVPDLRGGAVYAAADVLYHLPAGATDPQVVLRGEDEGIALYTVVAIDGRTYAAVTVTSGSEEQRNEALVLVDLSDPDASLRFGQTGGLESGLIAVSAGDGVVVIQTAGEGGIFTRAVSLDTEKDVSLPNGPPLECWNDFATDAGSCPWFFQIVDGGARYAWVQWNGSRDSTARLTVVDAATGVEQHSVDLGALQPTSLDVQWPAAVVNHQAIEGSDWVAQAAIRIDFSNPAPTAAALPVPGVAAAWPAAD